MFFFFQAEDGIRDFHVTGVQTCALPICSRYRCLFASQNAFELSRCSSRKNRKPSGWKPAKPGSVGMRGAQGTAWAPRVARLHLPITEARRKQEGDRENWALGGTLAV